ncbi:efflux RND transporter periplasmic adaptor subunit [Leifsonia shinshuensis]|uniref:efflux RND transporter periplasmic adaptor subunit n=1 Tax=Leifsonia shinshuensis TaxID=150026 RepID=UPI0035E58784
MTSTDTQEEQHTGRRRRRLWWLAARVALGVVAAIAAAAPLAERPADPAPRPKAASVTIERGTLEGSHTVPGVLDYAGPRNVAAGLNGIVTAVREPGDRVAAGDELLRIDDTRVSLMHGARPAWRDFEPGMTAGSDVRQLQESLGALGHFAGEPDGDYGARTVAAVRAWQSATGQQKTGRIELGRVVFLPADARIASVETSVGERVGAASPALVVTGRDRLVTADLKLGDQRLGVPGAAVTIALPAGGRTTGVLYRVGQPTERQNNGRTSTVVPIEIQLDRAEDADGVDRANVTLRIPTERREDVLSVPVEALLALSGDEFGVEVLAKDGTTSRLPVTTGLFAGGRVEISGDGVREGLRVVVPER